jgi:hypothetical protein
MGYVYLIGSKQFHWYKIGKTSDAKIRVSQLGVLLPFRIEIFALWKTSAPSVIERQLHEKYAAHRINGEWFGFTTEEREGLIADMLWASTDHDVKFENLPNDYAPEGKRIHFKYLKEKKGRIPEEIEFFAWAATVWKEAAAIKNPEERKARRRELGIETQKRKAVLWKLLDMKKNSA